MTFYTKYPSTTYESVTVIRYVDGLEIKAVRVVNGNPDTQTMRLTFNQVSSLLWELVNQVPGLYENVSRMYHGPRAD